MRKMKLIKNIVTILHKTKPKTHNYGKKNYKDMMWIYCDVS